MEKERNSFNWALLIGCALIALTLNGLGSGITSSVHNLANAIHIALQGNFYGSVNHLQAEPPEFMTQWQAASFLTMRYEEFGELIQSGELSGTYTLFQVNRRIWQSDTPLFIVGDMTIQAPGVLPMAPVRIEDGRTLRVIQDDAKYEIVIENHRVFSRELLTEWLNNRILGG